MSACLHRPEKSCVLVTCVTAVGSCICAAEVKQDEDTAHEAVEEAAT